jgi:hypothetical protein
MDHCLLLDSTVALQGGQQVKGNVEPEKPEALLE